MNPLINLLSSPHVAAGAEAPLRVLLVEDNPGDADLIRVFLRKGGVTDAQIECVERLTDALSQLAQGTYDVTILDLGLPDSQGLDTLKCVMEAHAVMPVVVLTGLADRAMGQAAVRAGAQDYFVKGRVDEEALTRALRYAIERKQTEAALRKQATELLARNKELTRFNRLSVGREMRMAELKREVDELCRRLGEPPRYGLQASEGETPEAMSHPAVRPLSSSEGVEVSSVPPPPSADAQAPAGSS